MWVAMKMIIPVASGLTSLPAPRGKEVLLYRLADPGELGREGAGREKYFVYCVFVYCSIQILCITLLLEFRARNAGMPRMQNLQEVYSS